MQQLLANTAQWIDDLNATIAKLIRWLALVMVLVTLSVVVLRYAFSMGTIVLQESITYMHGLLFMLGIPYGMHKDTHVRVDIVYAKLSPQRQNAVDLAGHLLFLLPIGIFILVTSLPYVQASWAVFEGSPEVGGIPAVFLLKSLIPVMAVLLCLQGISQVAKCLLKLRGVE